MLQLHRIFCATPWELEAERSRFDELIGRFNEMRGAEQGFLFVPVSLANIRDKRPNQYVIDENIRDCRHFVLVLSDEWGPLERNFRHDYRLALRCVADTELPMRSVAVLAKLDPDLPTRAEDLPAPDGEFTTQSEYDALIDGLLEKWLLELMAETGK